MSDTRNSLPTTQLLNPARRRLLPLASTAAALSLAGCAMTGGTSSNTPPPMEPPAAPMTAQQRMAADLVRQYTDSLDVALDRVDRERLRLAGEKKSTLAAAAAPVTPAAPAAQVATTAPAPAASASATAAVAPAAMPPAEPAAASPPPQGAAQVAETAQEPVILASSTAAEPAHGQAASAQAHPTPAAPAAPAAAAPSPAAAPAAAARVVTPPQAPVVTAIPAATPAPMTGAPVAVAKASTSAVEKALAPVARVTAGGGEVQATPVSTKTPSTAVITPIAVVPPSSPTAMGAMTAVAAAPAPEPAPAVAPVMAAAPAPEPSLEDAMAIVRKKVAANPTFNTALAMALLDPAGPHAADLVKELPEADQKVFSDLLGALQGMTASGGSTPADRAAPLVDAAKKWQGEADLALPKLVLATRVDSFGVYSAVEPRFEQGRKHTVIIYCEVANFSSKKADDGWYQTRLAQQETLITDDGLLVWRPNAEEVEDRSMNQRRDFYLVKKLTIPENLAAGRYTLRMSVTDRNTNKISMVSLPIEVVTR